MIESIRRIAAGLAMVVLFSPAAALSAPQSAPEVVISGRAPVALHAEYERIVADIESDVPVGVTRLAQWASSEEAADSEQASRQNLSMSGDPVVSRLVMTETSFKVVILLDNLEPGVHTLWLSTGDSMQWISGAVVRPDGVGLFSSDETRISHPYGQNGKDLRFYIKYNGTASSEVEELSRQLMSLPGDCSSKESVRHMIDLRACNTVRYLRPAFDELPDPPEELARISSDVDASAKKH